MNGPVQVPLQTLWASTELDVNGQDLSGLALRLQPGMTVSGKLAFDSTTPPLPDPTRTRVSLSVVTAPGASPQDASFLAIGASSFVMEKDGSFTIKGAAPGTYRLTFDTGSYHRNQGIATPFFSEVKIVFNVRDTGQRYHVPLLLSAFGYSTYRGA